MLGGVPAGPQVEAHIRHLWGMLYADVVSTSQEGLAKMMTVFVRMWVRPDRVREEDGDVCSRAPREEAVQIRSGTAGRGYPQTTSFTHLGVDVNELTCVTGKITAA